MMKDRLIAYRMAALIQLENGLTPDPNDIAELLSDRGIRVLEDSLEDKEWSWDDFEYIIADIAAEYTDYTQLEIVRFICAGGLGNEYGSESILTFTEAFKAAITEA